MKKIILVITVFIVLSLSACGNGTTTKSSAMVSTEDTFDENLNIQIYTRDTTSGTREAFFKGIDSGESVDDNQYLATGFVEVSGNGTMISSIVGDDYGIGYISLSSLDESGLIGLNFNGVEPTEENVLNNSYALKRPFMYIIRDDWTGMDTEHQIVEAFLAYMNTIDGKATIKNNAGIIVDSTDDQLWDTIKENYDVCSLDNSSTTIKFGGSTSVEKIAKALSGEFSSKCGNFIFDHNHTGSGDAYKRTQGSEASTLNQIHIGFASRDFKDSELGTAETFGQICWDAVVIVINNANDSLHNITTEEIKKIYAGEVTSWSELA